MDYLAAILLMLTGIFLMLLVLIQRGRGGGLAGAFGGMGGQSAFGTKAGDVFTKITVIVAIIWVVLAGLSILAFQAKSGGNYQGGGDVGTSLTAGDDADEAENGNDADADRADADDTEESVGSDEPESNSNENSSNESTATPSADESSEKPE